MELFGVFFLIGLISFVLLCALRISFWFKGQDIKGIQQKALPIIWNRKGQLFKELFSEALTVKKYRKKDRINGSFKAAFVMAFLAISILYQIKAQFAPQLEGINWFLRIFYAPFVDFLVLANTNVENFTVLDAFYGLASDTFAVIVLSFDLTLLIKVFTRKPGQFKVNWKIIFTTYHYHLFIFSRYLAEASTIMAFDVPTGIAQYWYLGFGLAQVMVYLNIPLEAFHYVLWSINGLALGLMIASIPFSQLWHIVSAPANILRRCLLDPKDGGLPRGRSLTKPFDLMEMIESENFDIEIGANEIEKFDWKQRISLDACMKCGACQDACPAYAAGRDLSPTLMTQALQAKMKTQFLKEFLKRPEDSKELIGNTVTEDTIWSCTTCAACIQACPIDNVHTEYLMDFRRHLIANNQMDKQKVNVITAIADKANPYGLPKIDRAAWAKDLTVPTVADNPESDYLYWVGCASSYDTRNQKIAKSLVKILNKAGVNFSILGKEEPCCGETVRRIGDEARYQEMVMENIEVLNAYKVKKIIVNCPHCYNTIKNEYPQLGGNFEVIHHSTLIQDLIQQNRLELSNEVKQTIAYHDPCYLGRYNGEYEAPREVLTSIPGSKLVELGRTKEKSFCCGGGGGNSWYEIPERESISGIRVTEALEANIDTLSVSCPYCISMLEDSLKVKGVEKKLPVKDIAELVAQSIN